MASLLPLPIFHFEYNGVPLSGGKVYTYSAGTTTPKNTFTTQTEGVTNANPVILDSQGNASIWGTGSYKIKVTDANDSVICTTDSITLQASQSTLNFIAVQGVTPSISPTVDPSATDGLAVGSGAVVSSTGVRAIAIGKSYASGTDAIAAGNGDNTGTYGAQGNLSVAVGYRSLAIGQSSVAIGFQGLAGGSYNAIIGGNSNITYNSPGDNLAIVGGTANSIQLGTGNSAIIGGTTNAISSAGGNNSIIGSNTSAISGSGSAGAIVGGNTNTVTGSNAAVIGGSQNTASGTSSTASGVGAVASLYGEHAIASGYVTAPGDRQARFLTAYKTTTTVTPAEMFLDNSSARMVIPTDTLWGFNITVIARRTDADNEGAFYKFQGGIDNNAGTVALLAAVVAATPIEDTSGWDCAVTADNTNKALIITVTGENSKTIAWFASIELLQITG